MSELKPCPKCGGEVKGYVCGGAAAFGCGEHEFEVCCACGIRFDAGPYETAEEAERKGVEAWNRRANDEQ